MPEQLLIAEDEPVVAADYAPPQQPRFAQTGEAAMSQKLLIVEDEPVVAIDLQEELQELGYEVTGLAESADAALFSIEEDKPDMILMDISIDGTMDGIQAARLFRDLYELPVVFLTSYSDADTLSRASREAPYGYLTKPFKSRDLQAMLRMAVSKAARDAAIRVAHRDMERAVDGVHEALLLTLPNGQVEFMNRSAEEMTGSPCCGRAACCSARLPTLSTSIIVLLPFRSSREPSDRTNSSDGCSACPAATWLSSTSRFGPSLPMMARPTASLSP